MIEVIPAILEKDFKEIKHKLGILRGQVKTVQLDIEDGVFVKNTTWPYSAEASQGAAPLDDNFLKIINEEEGMPNFQDFDFEIDLMVSDSVENFDLYSKLGAKKIIFHIEALGRSPSGHSQTGEPTGEAIRSVEEFREFLEGLDLYVRDDIKIGVAINPGTALEQIFPVIPHIDFVQVMGIAEIGFQHGTFDERAISHIRTLREKFSDLVISVDGGVNLDTAPLLVTAGAERLVIGSAIWKSDDIINTIKKFQEL